MKKTIILSLVTIMTSLLCPAEMSAQGFWKKVQKAGKDIEKTLNGVSETLNSVSDNSTTTAGTSKTYTPGSDGRLSTSSEADGIKLKVKSCNVDDENNAVIVFTLTNNRPDDYRGWFSNNSSEAYDDEGNLYQGSDIISYAPGNAVVYDYNSELKIPAGLTTKWKMRVRRVDPAATMLKKVRVRLTNNQSFYIYNLPITREGDE
ncbi:MAG: hypothetical protein NC098_04805 [Lachnoclostridium sp.]|nr:hypothetical protein [Lachnoclostridium sp.]